MSELHSGNRGPCLLGVDIGTESVRVGVFDAAGRQLALAAMPYRLSHPLLVSLLAAYLARLPRLWGSRWVRRSLRGRPMRGPRRLG